MAWPNEDFVHSAKGKLRSLLGPIAIIPGKPEAPLWPTGGNVSGIVYYGVFPLHIVVGIAQVGVGTGNLQFASECSAGSLSIPVWLIVHGAVKIAWPVGVGCMFAIFGNGGGLG